MAGRHPLTLNATELLRQPGTRRDLHTSVTLDELDVRDDRLSGDVALDVRLDSTLDHIAVAGTLTVEWHDACRRCLRPLHDTLRIAVDERYAAPDDTGQRPIDPEAFPIVNGQLDLVPMAREEVLLGPPDAPLCRDDCPGLCPVCGADRQAGSCDCDNEVRDERWAVLDALRVDRGGDEPSPSDPS
jgi:uncharacterized protein